MLDDHVSKQPFSAGNPGVLLISCPLPCFYHVTDVVTLPLRVEATSTNARRVARPLRAFVHQ
jgi:O-acetylhomoserine/O-acetylserine sulfhydrylase-like pyridoxal-dependent enzyme